MRIVLTDCRGIEGMECVPNICELGISITTFYKWWAKYGGIDVSMMSRITELEEEPTTEEDVPRGKALG